MNKGPVMRNVGGLLLVALASGWLGNAASVWRSSAQVRGDGDFAGALEAHKKTIAKRRKNRKRKCN